MILKGYMMRKMTTEEKIGVIKAFACGYALIVKEEK